MIDNKQKVLNLLGLAQRAGKIISGNDLVISSIKQNQAQIVFLAEEAGENTIKEFKFLTEKFELLLNQSFTGDELSQAIGKARKIVAVTDKGFAKAIMKLINQGV